MFWSALMMVDYDVLKVKLNDSSYEILIGSLLLERMGSIILPNLQRKKVAIVTDSNVANLYLERLISSLDECYISYDTLVLAPGELTKNWASFNKTVEWLIEKKIERDDIVVALGGGVIGDLVGFAASVVRRGVSVVQIPTTLLSQVDSSVGGKTGINSPQGKNLIGTFHQPKLVVIDSTVLKTLTKRDFLSGYSEVVKYGLLGDKLFFEWLIDNKNGFFDCDLHVLREALRRSCLAKVDIVTKDEKEKGQRALLNLGHTFGHALESATNYSDILLHGEGVSIGCVLAFKLSVEMGFCETSEVTKVIKHFKEIGLKTAFSDLPFKLPSADKFLSLMLNDKKVKNGALNLILANRIGDAFIAENVDLNLVLEFLIKELSKV